MGKVKAYRDGVYYEIDEAELNQPGPPPPPPPPSYRELRAVAYRDELGKDQGDVVKTLGDVIDVLIAEVVAIRSGAASTEAFAAMLPKIADIKRRFPQP